jgi:alpha-L-fucosidase
MNFTVMNKTLTIIICLVLTFNLPAQTQQKKFEPSVESLKQNYEYPEWFRDAKFGIYTHWGPVTYANQYNDRAFGWYGRLMYDESHPAFKYHQKHFGHQSKTGYKDIIRKFTAPKFDAKEWARLFAEAGAKFAGPVAVHHDNFLMWDSELTSWNSVDIGPGRDISGELAKAYREQGMKFMASFHHGFTYRFYEFAFQYDGHEAPLPYGPSHSAMPPETRDTRPWQRISRNFQELFLAKVQEFTDKYHPDLIYFDFGLGWHDEDIKLKMYSDFYNSAIAHGQSRPTVAQKEREGDQLYFSTLDLERGRMAFLTEYPWLTDDSPGSWFYYPNPKLQTANTMIDRFVDIVSKNGCLLLNVGPDHEGRIPDSFRKILREYGTWLKINGEGIYNTRPWYTYGEGSVTGIIDYYGAANSKHRNGMSYTSQDIRHTRSKNGKILYAFVLDWPESGKVKMRSLSVENPEKDLKVELLGTGNVHFKMNDDKTLSLDVSDIDFSKLPVHYAYCFKITGGEISWHPQGHYWLASTVVFKDENIKTVGFEGGEISYPVMIRHANRDYEVVTEIRSPDKDVELEISVYKEEHKRKGGIPLIVKLPVISDGYRLISLGKMRIQSRGKYFLEINGIRGDYSSVDISKVFLAVVRDQTILKVCDPI